MRKVSAENLISFCKKNKIEKYALCDIWGVSRRTVERAFVDGVDELRFNYLRLVVKSND